MTQCSFIEQYPLLTPDQCNTIIDTFNNDDRREPGKVDLDTIDPKIKASTDIHADFNNADYSQYNNQLWIPLTSIISEYVRTQPVLLDGPSFAVWKDYNIQHYKDGEGYAELHYEWMAYNNHFYGYRMMAWMINLNDAVCGTEFPTQGITLPAKQGVCSLWPAYWTHPHRGVCPNIGDKYIATGWLNFIPITHDEKWQATGWELIEDT